LVKQKLFVVVSMGGGVIDDVFIRSTEPEAEELFKNLTGITYKEYSDRRDKDEDPEEILGKDYDGTQIYEVEVEIEADNEIMVSLYNDVERQLSHALQTLGSLNHESKAAEIMKARNNIRTIMRKMGYKGNF